MVICVSVDISLTFSSVYNMTCSDVHAGSGSQAITSVRFLKMSKTRPPTVIAEFKGRIVEKSHLSALSRALRTSFGLHGVPVRVVPVAKKRRSAL